MEAGDMRRCAICGAEIRNPDPMTMLFLFHSEKNGREYYGCEKCAHQLSQMMESRKPDEVEEARRYFKSHIQAIEDSEVRDYLNELLQDSAKMAENSNREVQKRKDVRKKRNDSSANGAPRENASSGWIKGLRASAWAMVIFGAICGLVIGISVCQMSAVIGVLIIMLFPAFSLLSVSVLMVFLNMAEDIQNIRWEIEKKK